MTVPETSPALSRQEIEERILTFLRVELLPSDASVGREDDLLSDLLDSVAVLRLVTFVDEAFDVSTRPQDFVLENFQNTALLAEYVTRSLRA